jgi:hypothetical protein
MSFLYRHGLLIRRKQPYLDWANSLDDEAVKLTEDLSASERSLFLVPELDGEPRLAPLLEEFWEAIFEHELGAWHLSEDRWPAPRTREMFDQWFDVELNPSVYDLTPEEPLTQADIDAADLEDVMTQCASCGIAIGDEARTIGFMLRDRSAYEPFEGRIFRLPVSEGDGGEVEVVLGVVAARGSKHSQEGDDFVLRVCSSRCEKIMRSVVPKALRRWTQRVRAIGSAVEE